MIKKGGKLHARLKGELWREKLGGHNLPWLWRPRPSVPRASSPPWSLRPQNRRGIFILSPRASPVPRYTRYSPGTSTSPEAPPLAPAPAASFTPGWAEPLHATSTCHPGPLPHPRLRFLPHLPPRLRPPRPGRAPRRPATRPARSARRRFLCPAPPSPGRRGLDASERGGVANRRSAYSGLSPARPPIAAGGGGNIVEWSLDAAAAAGWSGTAAGATGVFRGGGVRRRRRQRLRVEAAEREWKERRKRAGVLGGGGGTGGALHGGWRPGRRRRPLPALFSAKPATYLPAGPGQWPNGGDRHGVSQTPRPGRWGTAERNRATEEPQEGGPAAWAARVPAQRGGCEGSGCPGPGTARGCSLGPSACQCSPGSGKPTCRRGIAAATTGAGSALAALASGALPGRRLLFPARWGSGLTGGFAVPSGSGAGGRDLGSRPCSRVASLGGSWTSALSRGEVVVEESKPTILDWFC